MSAVKRMVAFTQVDKGAFGRAVLTQRGEMLRTPDAKPLVFTAEQWIDASRVAFSWRARFPMFPGVSLHVEDAFDGEHGHLTGRVWGWLRVFRQVGPEVDRGQASRYLAELPWNPLAYVSNPDLCVEELGGNQVRVSCEAGGQDVHVDFDVDGAGRVTEARCPARPREVDGAFVDTPWVGEFGDWEERQGLMVPTSGEVAWELDGGRFTYWRGQVERYAVEPG